MRQIDVGPTFRFPKDRTIDGVEIRTGRTFFCRARLWNPRVEVTAIKITTHTISAVTGQQVRLWEVEAPDRSRFIVEPWMLSKIPIREVLERAKAGELRP